jgi:uncharacterized protein (TIGR02453 family)
VFPGFSEEAIRFFRGLARNNNREWFQPRKPAFEEHVRQPMRQLVAAVNVALTKFAPEYVTDPNKAIYRFYRDTRFSKDKKPYKDHIAASFPRRGLVRHEGAGYYFAVSHKEVAIGGGVYMPMPETLLAIRQRIAARHGEFRELIASRGVRRLYGPMQGAQLSRVPKGFRTEDPAADLLRYKQFLFYVELPAELATSPAIYTEIVRHFREISRFVNFLNAALVRSPKKSDF